MQPIALNFNLYEAVDSVHSDFIGAPMYDAQNEDWACEEVFAAQPRFFEMPHSIVGSDWRTALATVAEFIRAYLNNQSNCGARLRESQAVTVGFVDGNLVRVWPPEKADAPQVS